MEWLLNNIGLVFSIVFGIVSIVCVIIKLASKGASAIDIIKGIADVVKQFPDFIRMAEKVSSDPEVKKTFALNQAVLNCQAKGIRPSEEQLADMSVQIDNLVKLSKDININSKTTTTASTNVEIKPIQTIGGGVNEN